MSSRGRRPRRPGRRQVALLGTVLAVVAVGVLVPVLRGSSGPTGPSGPSGPSPSAAAAAVPGPAVTEPGRRTAAAIPGLDGLAPAPTTGTRPRASTSTKPRPAVASVRKGASIWKSAGMAAALRDSGVSWFYTWGADSKGVSAPGAEFVPMIWAAANADAATIARAKAAGRVLLGFNEPDLAGQAEMSVDTALSLWPKLQATGLRLGAPAVAAGADKAGGWLDQFMTGAAARGYRVDFIPLHWYGGDFRAGPATDQLKSYVSAVWARYHKPVWITEYALMRFDGGTRYPTAAVQSAFVAQSTAMLRTLPYVERYAWFSLATPDEGGDGTGLYRPDGTRTPAGDAYRSAG